jgi:hypothetical protein
MTRGAGPVPSKMTLQKLLSGPKCETRPARVTGIALRSTRGPHSALET